MERAQAERLYEIVGAAREQPAAAQAAFLDEACGEDAALRREVVSLLKFEPQARAFIELPAIQVHAAAFLAATKDTPTPLLPPGARVGDFQVVSLLGEGGMGEVYLAEDLGLARRPVALKMVKRGMASDALRRHFHRERLILAGLSHPHIARMYGAAVTADGLPYFVMEYVEGERLDTYCDARCLSLADRLAIFDKVAAAVSYAHRHLIVHRDLKPANIRVTPEGEPKLLDFGIARLLETPEQEQTVTLFTALTPSYASPEQIRGESMTTATDIYSLGVLLYELLCGSRPYQTKTSRFEEVARAVCEQAPERPSAAVRRLGNSAAQDVAAARNVTPARLVRQLSGDLDNIVLTALRKEPERRYASVDQLAGDLRRHGDGRPISARRETLFYVGAKFVRRHRAAAVIALLLGVSLLGGIVATSWQARRADTQRRHAEQRFEDVRQLANSLLFEIHDSVESLAGSTPTRQLIVARALQYLDGLFREADTPLLRQDLAKAYLRIGDIQGNPYSANLGDTDGALASYRKAVTLEESLQAAPARDDRVVLGRGYRAVGDILEVKGNFVEMLREYRRSLECFARLQHDFPADAEIRDEFARAYDVLGDGLDRVQNGQQEQLASYEKALALRQEMLRAKPGDRRLRRAVATGLAKVGSAITTDKKQTERDVQQSVEMLRALSADQPNSARARRELAWGLFSLGGVYTEEGNFAAALPVDRESIAIREAAFAADPQNKQAQFDLGGTLVDTVDPLVGAGLLSEALADANRGVDLQQRLHAADPDNAMYTRNCAHAESCAARAHEAMAAQPGTDIPARQGNWTDAKACYAQAQALYAGLTRQGTVRAPDAGQLAELQANITRCGDELAKLNPSSEK
jgi:tetratricopeptide (TPR) repeat protein/predicted Ser/Thr protein kinase